MVFEGSIDCVREATHEMVDNHLSQTTQMAVIHDMVSEIIAEHGQKWVRRILIRFYHEYNYYYMQCFTDERSD